MEVKTDSINIIDSLMAIFEKHKMQRICILATTCCGKSTIKQQIPGTADMDEEFWSQLTREEAFVCQKPWTKEIGDFAGRLVRERVAIKAVHPLFSLIHFWIVK